MNIFRIIEGVVSVVIRRPRQPLGYDYFEQLVDGENVEFAFSALRKDVLLQTDKPIKVKLNDISNPTISLDAGIWEWTDEWVSKIYITTYEPTNIDIYAGG